MGKRGTKPTPTAILDARGSWRADRKTNEIKPPKTKPKCPSHLSKRAKTYWKNLIPILETMGVLTATDRNVLSRYCISMAQWREAVERGAVDQSIKLSNHCLKVESLYGLNPSSRAGMAVVKDNPSENRGKSRFFKAQAG